MSSGGTPGAAGSATPAGPGPVSLQEEPPRQPPGSSVDYPHIRVNAYFGAKQTEFDAACHHLFEYEPPAIFGFRADEDPPLPSASLDRLIDYYARMRERRPRREAEVDMWAGIVEGHAVLTDPLEARDRRGLAAVLQDIGTTPLAAGVATHIPAAELRRSEEARQWEAMRLVDQVISLNEYRMLTQVLNPEQGAWRLSELNVPRMVSRGFTLGGRQIPPPRAGGSLFGVETPLGVYSTRDVMSFYTALQAEKVLGRCQGGFGVTEIGGGLGSLAYYAQQLKPKRWRLYDLPTMSVIQAYVLMRSLGEEAVHLWGEGDADLGISIAPYWLLYDYDEPTTLFINQDSFPEINRPDAERYMDSIVRSRPEYFLSINQEARAPDGVGGEQLVVGHLTGTRPELDRLHRSRDWLRKGWVEELYRHRNPRLS